LEAVKAQHSNEDANFPKPQPSRRGRPPGKRSHPEFEQITAYIRRDTHQAVKIGLLQNGRKEFSELIEDLLRHWLKSNT
jgi:hypothetical protein